MVISPSEIKHDKLHFCLNDILRCQGKWGGGGGGCPHHCTLLLMRSSVSSAVVAAISCLENVVLSFKEFNLQIFPLNIFWYIFSSDIVKFEITFPLSTSFVKIYIYILFVSCDDITSCLVTSC